MRLSVPTLAKRAMRAVQSFVEAVRDSDELQVWPPTSARGRLEYYRLGHLLYTGQHAEPLDAPLHRYEYYIVDNFLASLIDLVIGRAFREGITISLPDDLEATHAYLLHVMSESRLHDTVRIAATGAAYRGDAFLKTWYDAELNEVLVSSVDPRLCYPHWHVLDSSRMIACDIGQVIRDGNGVYLWIERHEMRDGQSWVVNSAWRLRERSGGEFSYHDTADRVPLTAINALAALPEEQPTGVDDLLVVHIPHSRMEEGQPWGDGWGVSALDGLITLQAALNDNLSGTRNLLRKMVRPIVIGPDILDEHGDVNLDDVEYLVSTVAGDGISIVTWNQDTAAVRAEQDALRYAMARNMGVDPHAVEPPASGGPMSGKAIRMSQHRTQATAQDVQAQWDAPLRRILSNATKLGAVVGADLSYIRRGGDRFVACEPRDIAIAWHDGLPNDRDEEIMEQSNRIADGTQSRVDAIMVLDELSREDAEAKLARIQAEQPKPTTPSFGLSPLFGPLDEGVPPERVTE